MNKKHSKIISIGALGALLLLPAVPALADGLTSNGHVQGEHATLTLTRDQIRELKSGGNKVTLTLAQRSVLADAIAIDAVNELHIHSNQEHTCTCELNNVGVLVAPDKIEVPFFLLNRAEVMGNTSVWSDSNSRQRIGEEAEMNVPHPSKEAELNKKGNDLLPTNPEQAIPFFEAALAANPNHKWAKQNLAMAYSELGRRALRARPPAYAQAVQNFELAISVDPSDSLRASSLTRPMRIAKYRLKHPAKIDSAKEVETLEVQQLSAEFKKSPIYIAYVSDVHRRIKRAWFPPKDARPVAVTFQIHKDGNMTDLSITSSSGSSMSDAAAKKAIENAVPFRPLPEGFPAGLKLDFKFEYDVFK